MKLADVRALLPRDKRDLASASRLAALEPDELMLVVDEAFEWIQDMNWPVAKIIAPALARLGPRAVPTLEKILQSDDDVWKYWALLHVVEHLTPEARRPLDALLESIARSPTVGERAEGLPEIAEAILAK